MARERGPHALGLGLPEPAAALDVGEQERDGAGGRGHGRRSIRNDPYAIRVSRPGASVEKQTPPHSRATAFAGNACGGLLGALLRDDRRAGRRTGQRHARCRDLVADVGCDRRRRFRTHRHRRARAHGNRCARDIRRAHVLRRGRRRGHVIAARSVRVRRSRSRRARLGAGCGFDCWGAGAGAVPSFGSTLSHCCEHSATSG